MSLLIAIKCNRSNIRVKYPSVVWWKATSGIKPLTRLQKSVCCGIPGAMSTTSDDTPNAIVNLQSLDLQIRKYVMKVAHSFKLNGVWGNEENTGHCQIYHQVGAVHTVLDASGQSGALRWLR